VIYGAVRGSLDFTSINSRREFLMAAVAVCAGVGLAAAALHRRSFADTARLAADEATLMGLVLAACVLHVFVYEWPLGFPLPGPGALFFPFLAPVFVIVHALIGIAACAFTFWRARR
jgi:hypothetical protein